MDRGLFDNYSMLSENVNKSLVSMVSDLGDVVEGEEMDYSKIQLSKYLSGIH